jgi:hypothetical protein
MIRKALISALALALVTTLSSAPAQARTEVSVGLSFFYDELAPYGQWVTVRNYGQVWSPRGVAAGWQPYLYGEWRYTDYGWTWVSFDPWGGDPYHYGTWVFTDEWGWVWVPGTIWAPAWVTWCDYGSHIGWAPVPPSISIGLVGYSGPAIVAPARSYVFVPTQSFVGVDVRKVRVDPARNATFVSGAQKTTSFAVSGGIVRTGGPQVSRIQKVTGAPVQTSSLSVAKTRAVPIRSPARATKKALPVVMPARERAAALRQHEPQGGNKAAQVGKEPARGGKAGAEIAKAPAPKKKVEAAHTKNPSRVSGGTSPALARPAEPSRKPKAQAPARPAQPPPEIRKEKPQPERKPQAPARQAEPPHEKKAQTLERPAAPPPEAKAQPPERPAAPPPEAKAQPPERRAPPPPEAKAPAPARPAPPPPENRGKAPVKKPEKQEKPE